MAKGHGKRRNSRFQVLKVDASVSLSTLGNGGTILLGLMAITGQFKVVAADLLWAIDNLTAGEGPIQAGLSNGDLSTTEVQESLDSSPTSESDIIARERARRPVRSIGVFPGNDTHEVLNDGRMMRTKFFTQLAEGDSLMAFVRNQSGAALTTGAVLRVQGRVYGYWQ